MIIWGTELSPSNTPLLLKYLIKEELLTDFSDFLKVMEHLAKEEPIQNPDWTLLMFSGDRAQRLKIDEYSEMFSEALKEETEFHSTLYHMVKDFASKEAMEKIRSAKCQFINSVCHMLLSIRLLSYS